MALMIVIMVGANGTVLFSLWINVSMTIFGIILLTLESSIDYTIIVIMQHVILYVVCLLSNCTVFIVLYSMYQSLAVFIAVSAVSVLVFYLLLLKLRPLRMRSRAARPLDHVFI